MVIAKMIRRSYGRGENLFLQGDLGHSVHIIERGCVAIRTSTPAGDEVTLAVLGVGDFFGEQSLIADEARRTASAVALDPVETLTLHRRDFDDLCRTHPSVMGFLVRLLASQVRRLSDQMLDVLFVPVDDRVVRSLARLTDFFRPDRAGHIEVPIRQEDLASIAGTTRPTTNRVLRRLEHDGVVTLHRGRTTIVDPTALRSMQPQGLENRGASSD
jgi:CRP-like cAMP-binding protein